MQQTYLWVPIWATLSPHGSLCLHLLLIQYLYLRNSKMTNNTTQTVQDHCLYPLHLENKEHKVINNFCVTYCALWALVCISSMYHCYCNVAQNTFSESSRLNSHSTHHCDVRSVMWNSAIPEGQNKVGLTARVALARLNTYLCSQGGINIDLHISLLVRQ